MATDKVREQQTRLVVKVDLHGQKAGETAPEAHVYLFSKDGDTIDRKPLDGKGQATFQVPVAQDRQSFRVLVGPATGAEEDAFAELVRRGAAETGLTMAKGKDLEHSIGINRGDWERWLIGRCCVKGHVVKRIGSGTGAVDLNVCESIVEIYEVDPWFIIIDRIPDSILEKLRKIILQPIPFPWPPIGPDPGPVEGPTDPIPWFQDLIGRKTAAMQVRSATAPASFPTQLTALAKTSSAAEFRSQLVDYRSELIHWFCYYWPWYVRTTKVCQTKTNCEGKFTCCYYHSWFNPDIPDLWFRVRQVIGGVDTVIYERYPVACHTWWDYACGSEVTLYVTNPSARTCCNEPPVVANGNWVILEAIGATSPYQIRGSSHDPGTAVAGDGHDKGWTRANGPFGGLIRPRLRFKDTLRPLGVMYYRVSWAPQGTDPANNALWNYLDQPVSRHFIHEVAGHPTYDSYPLGPHTIGTTPHLMEIPPSAPPAGDWAFPPQYERDDLTSAYFETTGPIPAASAGKYDIRVQLYNAAGVQVQILPTGIKYYVPSLDDLSGTILTDDAAGLGMVVGDCLIMTLHVDNNVCTAIIAPPEIAGHGADPDCGGLEYAKRDQVVTMAFEASHPHQFATYGWYVYRGHANLRDSDSGEVGAGSHLVTDTVDHLMEHCNIGAFAEYLYVYAKAIDGWDRLSGYDRFDVFAFTLLPA